jgi:transcriptional regulator with XRE-family HTH domain
MDYRKVAGRRLKKAREGKGLTLASLSELTKGVFSPSRLGNYEQGIRMMGTEEALALAPLLGVNASFLLCVEEEKKEGEMTAQEEELLRNFRALPERDRADYARRISVLALAYKEPVPDEKLSPNWASPESLRSAAKTPRK